MYTVALAFSGGGFRAACFSLGTLSYLRQLQLDKKPFLEKVTFISSTSGGSITNLVYSAFIFEGKTFEECYAYLLKVMEGEDLLEKALKILDKSDQWKARPDKTRNLINAFSIAYDEAFTGRKFDLYRKWDHSPHLEEICVNSTEFTNGLPFRFQNKPPGTARGGKMGNFYIYFKPSARTQRDQLKLGDILASSSCFPSGFEPMIFPNDYSHAQLTVSDLRNGMSYKANRFTLPPDDSEEEPDTDEDITNDEDNAADYNHFDFLKDEAFENDFYFGVMDGGVADNQAIDGFKKADKRRKDHPFDLFIASDVTSFFMDGYTLPLPQKKWYGSLTINILIGLWIILGLILPVMLLGIPGPWQAWQIVVGTLSGIGLVPLVYIVIRKIVAIFSSPGNNNSWSVVFNKYKKHFFRIRLSAVQNMIVARAKSIFILANDIYLKQIRRMYYSALFADPNYTNRSIQNTIYDLSKAKFPGTISPSDLLDPTKDILAVAEKARTMGTTLWFDPQHQQENMKESIVATGQFTTCFNLLKYILEQEDSAQRSGKPLSPELQHIKPQLEKHWLLFKTHGPFALIKKPELFK